MLRQVQILRGLAVTAVVLFHLKPELIPSGYLGVDIFFLISGFVITKKLINNPNKSYFRQILDFSISRARRLMPSVSILVFIVSIISFFLQDPIGAQQSTSKAGIASLVGIANLFFAKASLDYFGTPAQSNPFLHMWSLGIEYQFYLVFPLLIIPMRRLTNKIRIPLISLILLISLGLTAVSETNQNYEGIASHFYNPNLRIWEFLIGAVLYLSGIKLRIPTIFFRLLPLGIFGALVYLKIENGFTWLCTLAMILMSSFSLICYPEESTKLETKLLENLGNMSFSMYLWHWPVIVFVRSFFRGNNFLILSILLIIMCTVLSYKFVESSKKLRFVNRGSFVPLFAWVLIPVSVSGALGLIASEILYPKYLSGQYSSSLNGQIGNIGRLEESQKYLICKSERKRTQCEPKSDISDSDVLLVGDSHAGVLANSLANGLETANNSHLVFYYTNGLTQAIEKNDLELIKRHVRKNNYKTIILAANWDRLGVSKHLRQFMENLPSRVQTYLIEDNPVFPFSAYRCGFGVSQIVEMRRCDSPQIMNEELPELMINLKKVKIVFAKKLFCNQGVCSMKRGNKLLYFDSNHLNSNGARLLSKEILNQLSRFPQRENLGSEVD